jgi:hypothetical protein
MDILDFQNEAVSLVIVMNKDQKVQPAMKSQVNVDVSLLSKEETVADVKLVIGI